ncbi:MFS transporter [Rheinheimera sp. UJ51]|uniref:MFS transporter n=1 Tax=unclassified Rheinheimera TaxID=115860 RepID=UPI001E62201C|nr:MULTISPECIES: MFS transporter [unclassified Rheinheimera]MCC5451168.1 MFS transporter [Rheinheimera sp. UJ51]MCF4010083.1 MFS transporter [Rheinheimera sp. UJ63]
MFRLTAKPALSLAYFAYFGVLGIFVPYFGLFLDGRGYQSAQIGLLLALVTATRIVGPALWGTLADRTANPLGIMRFGASIAIVAWLSSLVDFGFWPLLLGFAVFSFFWTAILPQLEVCTFHSLNDDTGSYSKIRTFGSIGYIVLVMLGGWLYQRFGSEFMPGTALLFLFLLLLSLVNLPPMPPPPSKDQPKLSFAELFSSKVLWQFMAAAFLLQMSFAPFYGFFTLYSRDLGYSGTLTGLFIGLAVLAEIIAFYYAGRILQRFSFRRLLACCYGLTVIRWLMLAFVADSPWLLALSMLFHAGSFAIAHSCAMQFIQQFFPKAQRGRGQAFYAGIIYGGGGALGAYISGISWQNGLGAEQTYVLAAIAACFAAILAWCLPKQMPKAALV